LIEILDVIYFNTTRRSSEAGRIRSWTRSRRRAGQPRHQLIEIQGHTDERGDDNYNLDLSDRRSKSVRQYMIDKGVDEKRMTAQGYGETQPLDRRHNEAAWAKNRRVAFLILKRSTD
jgi:outer membrane protein OmpA-like peptidoglycan-associated protein